MTIQRQQGGRSVIARSGQSLSDGNIINTGRNSFVYLQLDATAIAKIDEMSRAQITAIGNSLFLNVLQGAVLVVAIEDLPTQTLDIRIGNPQFTIRG